MTDCLIPMRPVKLTGDAVKKLRFFECFCVILRAICCNFMAIYGYQITRRFLTSVLFHRIFPFSATFSVNFGYFVSNYYFHS